MLMLMLMLMLTLYRCLWLSVYNVNINININITINIDFKQFNKVYGCQYIKLTLTLTLINSLKFMVVSISS